MYSAFGAERAQPLIDLVSRVRASRPRRVVDLGCGPGSGVPVLRAAWPDAVIVGVDSSPEMLERAAEESEDPNVSFIRADIREISHGLLPGGEPADVVISNAALHWLPDHRRLLPSLMELVAPGGVLAVQVPGSFSNPSHRLLYDMSAEEPYRAFVDQSKLIRPTASPQEYLHDVARPGWEAEAWETTYCHVLQGEDPVFAWISSTGARPVLDQLPEGAREQFVTDYKAALREAYPRTEIGTVLPFRPIFFLARREAD
ncbi:methyltransferase domain-containing protein [Nesterenkonia populi]